MCINSITLKVSKKKIINSKMLIYLKITEQVLRIMFQNVEKEF